jgi:hypothetical protein
MDDVYVPRMRIVIRHLDPDTGVPLRGKKETRTGTLTVTPLDLTFRYKTLLGTHLIEVWREEIASMIWVQRPILWGWPMMRFSTAIREYEFQIPQWRQVRAARTLLTTDIRQHRR